MQLVYKSAKAGNLHIGKNHPVVLQSMTNTATCDIDGSVAQCIRIFDAGAHMVRLTTQGLREVECLTQIRNVLRNKGYDHPLVADVHFLPEVAEAAAKVVDKIRINPGNYTGRNYNGPLTFDAKARDEQLEIIRSRLSPLIKICKENKTAIRIGVNHGSLSSRLLSWYGDTPTGMVESALEFIQIFNDEGFHNLVISLKASDSKLMIHANRLLYKRMQESGVIYPLHLGVTEAGSDEDGRIKSAVGIGSLLADGIGDTIRVSLTEDPEYEIPVAKKISECFTRRNADQSFLSEEGNFFDPFNFIRRKSNSTGLAGGNNLPVVIAGSPKSEINVDFLRESGYIFNKDKTLSINDRAADYLCAESVSDIMLLLRGLRIISEEKIRELNHRGIDVYRLYRSDRIRENSTGFVKIAASISSEQLSRFAVKLKKLVIVAELKSEDVITEGRGFFKNLHDLNIKNPVILHRKYSVINPEALMIKAAGEIGSLLVDGFADGIWLEGEQSGSGVNILNELAFNILQATGVRISKIEYIACPSCGRTLFNIQETLRKIKDATSEMKGLKIAVMGCIVNGPGEMADADYGYVGAGKGKVSLYKGKEQIMKNIPEEDAVEELIRVIKEHSG